MITVSHSPEVFPETHAKIIGRLGNTEIPDEGSVVLFGGSARSGLLEITSGIERPIRDIDLIAIGDSVSDNDFLELHHVINPEDQDWQKQKVFRYPDIESLLQKNIDFTINESVVTIGNNMKLVATPDAIEACRTRIIEPTAGRIAVTKELQDGGEDTFRAFRRNQTGMPARAAYFVSVFRASGIDFDYNLLDHPKPEKPEDSHMFFLGLMVEKALCVDEVERGAGDTTATKLLFETYRELGLTDKDVKPRTPEQIIEFCEQVNGLHPQMKFYGSEISKRVKHTDRPPEAKIS